MDIRRLPFINVIRRPGRTIALVLLTMLLSASVFGGSVIILSLQQGLHSLESRLGADIIVVPSSAQSKVSFKNMLLQGTTGAFYMDPENLTRTREVEGVKTAAPQTFLASLKADCCSVKIQVIGFDPETDFIVQPWIEQSRSRRLDDMEVMVGSKVTADVGETLRIYDERCHVAGRLAVTGTGLDTAVYCTMNTMKKLLQAAEGKGITHKIGSDTGDISAIYVKVEDGYDIDRVNSAIQGHTRKCSAVRTKSMITDVSGSLAGISSMVTVLIAAVWGLSVIILLIAFAMIANERRREFALLRMMGTSKRHLGGIVLREAELCSLLGGSLGIALAAIGIFPFTTLMETSLKLPYLTPPLWKIILMAFAALAAAILAGCGSSVWAARRLSCVDPGMVLRENG